MAAKLTDEYGDEIDIEGLNDDQRQQLKRDLQQLVDHVGGHGNQELPPDVQEAYERLCLDVDAQNQFEVNVNVTARDTATVTVDATINHPAKLIELIHVLQSIEKKFIRRNDGEGHLEGVGGGVEYPGAAAEDRHRDPSPPMAAASVTASPRQGRNRRKLRSAVEGVPDRE